MGLKGLNSFKQTTKESGGESLMKERKSFFISGGWNKNISLQYILLFIKLESGTVIFFLFKN